MKSLSIILLTVAAVSCSIEQYENMKPQVVNMKAKFTDLEAPEFKALSDATKTNKQVAAEVRKRLSNLMDIHLKETDLETLLIKSSSDLHELIDEEVEFDQINPLSEKDLTAAALQAAKDYENIGDFKDYSVLEERFKNLIVGHLISNHFQGDEFSSDFMKPVKEQLEDYITNQAMKRQEVTDVEDLDANKDVIYTEQKYNLAEFLNTADLFVNQATQKALDVKDYQINVSANMFNSIFAVLTNAFLNDDYINSQNASDMNARIKAMIKAFFLSAKQFDEDITKLVASLNKNLPLMKENYAVKNDKRIEFFEAALDTFESQRGNRIVI